MNKFREQGYLVVRNFYDIKELFNYTLSNKPNGNYADMASIGTPAFYNDVKMAPIHEALLSKMEEVVDTKLFKTYCYYRTYKRDDTLLMHTDREACEISISMNIGYDGDNWAIYMVDRNLEPMQVFLEPGDALIYKGMELVHWRAINKYSDNYSQVFFHYVDQFGPCKWAKGDLYTADPNEKCII